MKYVKPQTEHGIIYRASDTMYTYQGWPSVCRDENGTIYVVASAMRFNHVCPFGKTAMWVSKDNGKTFTPPIIVNDSYLDDRDAGILYMGKGRMLITWFRHPASWYISNFKVQNGFGATYEQYPAEKGMLESWERLSDDKTYGGSFIKISEDYGVTWSNPIQLQVSAPHGPNILADGTLIYLGKDMYSASMDKPQPADTIGAYVSTDGGYTWQKRGDVHKPDDLRWDNLHEPHVVELADGTLLGAIRGEGAGVYHGLTVYTTRSADGGCTWSPLKALNISGAPPHLLRVPTGEIVLTVGRREVPFGQYALISRDNGETWSEEYAVDDRAWDGDLGYPATVRLGDGTMFTVYYQKYRSEDGSCEDRGTSIMYTKWKLGE